MFEGEKEILFTVEMSIHELYLLFAAPTTGQSISSYEVSRFTCRIFSYRKLDKCGGKNRDTNPSRSRRSEAARTFEFDKGSAELLLLPSPAQRSHGTQAGACAQTKAQQTLELASTTMHPVSYRHLEANIFVRQRTLLF